MLRLLVIGSGLAALLAAADTPTPPPAQTPPPPPAAAPSGQLRGAITTNRHEPAVGAIVLARPESAPSPVRVATTGTNGTFAFDRLPDGAYRVEVRRDGFVPVVKPGIVVRAPFRAVVEVLLTRGAAPKETVSPVQGSASLAGSIRVGNGAPLAEARVRLTRVDGTDDSRMMLTTGSGGFSFPELAAGRWRLEVQGAGLLPLRASLDLAGDVAIEAQLAAQPANYRPSPQDLLVPEDVIPPPGP